MLVSLIQMTCLFNFLRLISISSFTTLNFTKDPIWYDRQGQHASQKVITCSEVVKNFITVVKDLK